VNRFADTASSGAADELALSRAIQNLYRELETQALFEERRASLLSLARGRLKALASRQQRLQHDLERGPEAEELRRAGELLQIALPRIVRGQDQVVVENVFEPDAPPVTIKLSQALSAEQNIQHYFRRYKKLKAAHEFAGERLAQTRGELAAIEALAQEIRMATDPSALDVLQERARAAGLLLPHERRIAERSARGPRRFISADGMEILIGRNERENHELTFAIARGNDYWMHLLGWQGPHVVIRKPPDKDVPLETLLDAAHLAVHFSRIRGADFAEVVYTQRKHVRPVRRAGPGRVSYAQSATLAVRLDPGRLRKLLNGGRIVRGET
jgi:predicted ribosome quality control (RQC) complex YloA/Tae2 family protein